MFKQAIALHFAQMASGTKRKVNRHDSVYYYIYCSSLDSMIVSLIVYGPGGLSVRVLGLAMTTRARGQATAFSCHSSQTYDL
jgi:hypothetical protein